MLYGSGIQVLYVLLLFFQVIARIFYVVNRSWSGRLGVSELRRSNFLSTLRLLDEEDDINAITDFFSYEHFYVIYCKFWELDKDHDLFIDREDLSRHNDHGKQQTVAFRESLFQDDSMVWKDRVKIFLLALQSKISVGHCVFLLHITKTQSRFGSVFINADRCPCTFEVPQAKHEARFRTLIFAFWAF